MPNLGLFSISISREIPELERQRLLGALQAAADLQEPTTRGIGPEWVTFVAIAKDVGIVAGSAAAILKLTNEIIQWRRNLLRKAIEPKVRLQRPDRPPLDLSKCQDSEVEKWLS